METDLPAQARPESARSKFHTFQVYSLDYDWNKGGTGPTIAAQIGVGSVPRYFIKHQYAFYDVLGLWLSIEKYMYRKVSLFQIFPQDSYPHQRQLFSPAD